MLELLDEYRQVGVLDLPQDDSFALQRQGVSDIGWFARKIPSGSCSALTATSRS
jgi:hypothetical protein